MFRTGVLTLMVMIAQTGIRAQNVGINVNGAAPDASALLDVDASGLASNNKKGFLVPRMTSAERAALPLPAQGLLVYETTTNTFWYFDGTVWVQLFSGTPAAGWLLTGNAGTNPATEFIGTTDANDWAVRTGGAAPGNERMRVQSGGRMVVNNTGVGANTQDVFSVYANGTTNGTTTNTANVGIRAINGYTATGYGVQGVTSGTSTATFGLIGLATAATGQVNAVRGESASRNGRGLVGIANTSGAAIPSATNAIGGLGQVDGTLSGTAIGFGLLGIAATTMTTGDARGVQGQSASNNGTGVLGLATSTAAGGQPVGVYGQASNATGFGMQMLNTNATGTGMIATGNNIAGTYLINGSGGAIIGSGIGLFSYGRTAASGTGVLAVGNNQAAFGTLVNGSGVAATGLSFGVYGVANSNANGTPGNPARAGGYFESGTTNLAFTYVAAYEGAGVPRKVMGNGTVNTVVTDTDGQYVLLSAPEAPENLFQDHGTASLVDGRAHVALDPILTRNILVDEEHPLRVFIQLRGDCMGVYVTNETAEGFDVVELQGGTSDVSFHWQVVASRANVVHPDGTEWRFADERFPRTQGPQEREVHRAMPLRTDQVRDPVVEAAEPASRP